MLTEKDYERAAEIETDCRIRDKFEDSRFGDVFILEVGKSSKKIMMTEKVFHSKNEAGDEIQALKKRMTYQHENLLSLLEFSTKVVKGVLFQHFPHQDLLLLARLGSQQRAEKKVQKQHNRAKQLRNDAPPLPNGPSRSRDPRP